MSNTFEINSVKSDNIDMEYLKFGSGEKNLVIIPGLSIKSVLLSAEGVVSAYNAFADDYTVYLFDRNKIIREHYTVDDMAEETAFAIKTIGIKNADFFGVSQGGMIAECIAIKYPELVHKMVLGSTMARVNETAKCAIEEWIHLARERNLTALVDNFAEKLFSKEFCNKFGEFIRLSNVDVTDDELDRFIRLAGATDGFDVFNSLDKINCPVLILGAENDRVVSGKASKEMAKRIQDSEIYMYDENYGHGVYDEAPDYKDRILEFLRK